MESSIGTAWLTNASSPSAAMNAVTASTTGMSAATRAPKAMSRMPKANGTAVHSAFLKSLAMTLSNQFSTVASPTWWTSIPTWAARTTSTAAITGAASFTAAS